MKYFKSFLLSICFSIFLSSFVNAGELQTNTVNSMELKEFKNLQYNFLYVDDEGQNYIRLIDAYIPFDFNLNDVEIERIEYDNDIEVIVTNISSGEILFQFGESINSELKAYDTVTVYIERTDGPAVSRLESNLVVWNEGSFFQINEVQSTRWLEMSGGAWYHKNMWADTASTTNKWPTNKVQIKGDGTIEIKTTNETTGGFSIGALKIAGFSFDATIGAELYFRKYISDSFFYGR